MVKLAQIQAGELLDLLQTVDQGISVDEQLPGSLGNVQVVLKELIDGKQSLLIQAVDGILLEHFAQEDLAQCGTNVEKIHHQHYHGKDGVSEIYDLLLNLFYGL